MHYIKTDVSSNLDVIYRRIVRWAPNRFRLISHEKFKEIWRCFLASKV